MKIDTFLNQLNRSLNDRVFISDGFAVSFLFLKRKDSKLKLCVVEILVIDIIGI